MPHRPLILLALLLTVVRTSHAEFQLIADGRPVDIFVDSQASPGLRRVAGWLADDMQRVSGLRPEVKPGRPAGGGILVGVIGAGGELGDLIKARGIDVSAVEGKREASVTAAAGDVLLIAGSDKRGAIYGMLDLSREIGVSPWYWWADVPVQHRSDVSVASEPQVRDPPKVRYRGIFLNDEAPALANWSNERFGGCNSEFYAHVFELILRLRGNFLWPAMWGRSLFDDDPASQRLADELGVVLSTSHHEPMQRAHAEWSRYGKGPWDYDRNAETLRDFWRAGVRRMGNKESVVTLGMRGDGDEPMTEGANIALLERIVRDQREILAEELGRPVTDQPQVWALYKEVQEYYDRGMRAPDDVILLLCDDNWGNVRRLPSPEAPRHPGGYGMYYHFDYVGDPRNYKWLNTNSLPRVWEQMHLTWKHGVDQIWVVNVGDLKPMEEPIDFFLTMAYDPDRFPAKGIGERIDQWRIDWAREQFGDELAGPIAEVLKRYAKLAARRKPELLDANSYSLGSHDEWGRVVAEWKQLMNRAQKIAQQASSDQQAAYYQLVLHPVLAMGNLHELYFAVAMNHALAEDGDPAANEYADAAEAFYAIDQQLTDRYHALEGGKWNHMMSQTHIGYTSWQEPRRQRMPDVRRVDPDSRPATEAAGAAHSNNGAASAAAVGFVERNGYVSIEAPSFASSSSADGVGWVELPDHGRTGSAMMPTPVTAAPSVPGEGACLSYPIWLTSAGPVTVDAYLSPTHDFYGADDHGIRFAVSIDDGKPVVVDMHADRSTNEHNPNPWRERVRNSIHIASTPPIEAGQGAHTLRFWRIDSGLVLQKLVVRTREIPPSTLGPPESTRAE
ncbi:hypothetical protein KOR34_44700 [Posidoniimonas corsicana]|uniref:Gylcosyl hydrolase 115 C-terminal domain-containing protein n=1 Tax=Posidoniimonas corsicana TaxID=1938618 RepID=A0A5C5UXK7_9BACT|nr:glycosyl hydrolase 115 family protein [Posidoniimonas corsicana]TWT31096.1 hypothetical protein KOR34_44700 [Posidoniimonas corsicana]